MTPGTVWLVTSTSASFATAGRMSHTTSSSLLVGCSYLKFWKRSLIVMLKKVGTLDTASRSAHPEAVDVDPSATAEVTATE
jgi:hypothetical protein